MVFIGYELGSKVYHIWNPKSRSIIVSTTVCFDKSCLLNKLSQEPKPVPNFTPLPAPSSIQPKSVDIGWLIGDLN